MEKIDASGPNAMFGVDDMNFDLQLEEFGVDTNALKKTSYCVCVLCMGRGLGSGTKEQK